MKDQKERWTKPAVEQAAEQWQQLPYYITRPALRTSLGMSGSVYGCMAIFSERTVQMDSINSNEIPRETLLYIYVD